MATMTSTATTTETLIPTCDCCDRRTPCVSRVHSSYAGDTDACCRCTMTADADGFCDDCRVGTLVPVVVVDNSPMARMAQRKRERDFATEGEARAHEDMLDKAADAQDAYMKKWGLC